METVHYLNFLKYFVMKVFCFVVCLSSLGNVSKFFTLTSFLWLPFQEFLTFNGEIFYGLLPPVIW